MRELAEVSKGSNNTIAGGHNRNQSRTMYKFSLDDVDNNPSVDDERDNEEADANDIADDLQ